MTIEERITRLEDIESIRQLQACYQRCLDTRDFDGVAACFTEDVTSAYGNGTMSYKGKHAVMDFLTDVMTLDMPSTHLIHGGEIDVITPETAKAMWYLEDHLEHQKYLMRLWGAAIYDVSYVKVDGKWYISSIGYKRCYEFFEHRGLINLFTLRKKTFFKAIAQQDEASLGEYGKLFRKKHKK